MAGKCVPQVSLWQLQMGAESVLDTASRIQRGTDLEDKITENRQLAPSTMGTSCPSFWPGARTRFVTARLSLRQEGRTRVEALVRVRGEIFLWKFTHRERRFGAASILHLLLLELGLEVAPGGIVGDLRHARLATMTTQFESGSRNSTHESGYASRTRSSSAHIVTVTASYTR